MNDQRALASAEASLYLFLTVVVPSADGSPPTTSSGAISAVPGHGRLPRVLSRRRPAAVAKVRTLDELRRFTVAQGVGWLDVHILRANGFQVEEVTSYEAMFKMVAQSRLRPICSAAAWSRCARGRSNADLPDLILDKTFALVYDLPQFFYTHRSNRSLADRVTLGPGDGLRRWFAAGPVSHPMGESLRFADLSKRRLFRLNAPPPKGIDFDYRRYRLDLSREIQ